MCRTVDILSELCEVRLSFLSFEFPSRFLWFELFLEFSRRNNVGSAQRDDVRKSYEFTLNHVGQDKESGEIWNDYIQFLQSGEVRHPFRSFSGPVNTINRQQRHGKNNRKWMPSVKFTIALFKFH